jgi:hypothetical protein
MNPTVISLPVVKIMALGGPVVPEVYIILLMSSRAQPLRGSTGRGVESLQEATNSVL